MCNGGYTARALCPARACKYYTHSQSAGTCVVGWGKTPSFSFCQVDMYGISMFDSNHFIRDTSPLLRACSISANSTTG